MKNEIQLKKYEIEEVQNVGQMATTLKTHVIKEGLYSNIKGKNYVEVEGWQFAGGLLGFMPRVVKVENMSSDGEMKWFAEVEIYKPKDGTIVSRGFAICSSKEKTKQYFDEYAILSMAQTRAIGKAYRTILSWIMKMAGYEGTPAEEMTEKNDGVKVDDKKQDILLEVEKELEKVETKAQLKNVMNKYSGNGKEVDKLILKKSKSLNETKQGIKDEEIPVIPVK